MHRLFLFHSPDRSVVRPSNIIQIYSGWNEVEIICSSGANIHINKCYFAKSYSAKCCKEKIRNILGIGLCVKLFCRTSIVSQMICEVSPITSYAL